MKRIPGVAVRGCLVRRTILLGWMVSALTLGAQTEPSPNPADAPTPTPNPLSRPMTPGHSSSVTPFLQSTPGGAPPVPDPNLSLKPKSNETPAPPALSSGASNPSQTMVLMRNPQGMPSELSRHLLVVYNAKDPDSQGLAAYYVAARKIAADHVLGIMCPTTEEISRAQYESTIREPIISYLYQKGWMTGRSEQVRVGKRMMELLMATRNDIWAIALIRGVPLKIAPDPSDDDCIQPESSLRSNAAAVDSELAMLPVFGLPRGGYAPNPFFDIAMNGLLRAGPELATKIVMVTRLDGPTPQDVRRMIDDTLYAEKNRLAGLAVIDSRGRTDPKDNFTAGDNWFRTSRDLLVTAGWPVKFEATDRVLDSTDPLNHVALYLGWYAGGATGPWVTPPDRFVRGAIAYHLHSFSAATLRSPRDNWTAPLLAHGAAASMGTVYEPYLALTPRVDIFTKRILEGNSFAEAAYASQRGLSWMVTVVGDPLYRPFAKSLEVAVVDAAGTPSDQSDWLRLLQLRQQINLGRIPLTVAGINDAFNLPDVGPVLEEGLGDILAKLTEPGAYQSAEAAYQKAMALDTTPVDRIRLGLKLVQIYNGHSQRDLAQAELRTLLKLYPQDAVRFGIPDPNAPKPPLKKSGNPALPPGFK